MTFLAVAYSSLRTSSASQLGKLGLGSEKQELLLPETDTGDDDDERSGQKVVDTEKEGVQYNWCFFHLVFVFASFYLMMVLTSWAKIGSVMGLVWKRCALVFGGGNLLGSRWPVLCPQRWQ